jgi:hypothetical protein
MAFRSWKSCWPGVRNIHAKLDTSEQFVGVIGSGDTRKKVDPALGSLKGYYLSPCKKIIARFEDVSTLHANFDSRTQFLISGERLVASIGSIMQLMKIQPPEFGVDMGGL